MSDEKMERRFTKGQADAMEARATAPVADGRPPHSCSISPLDDEEGTGIAMKKYEKFEAYGFLVGCAGLMLCADAFGCVRAYGYEAGNTVEFVIGVASPIAATVLFYLASMLRDRRFREEVARRRAAREQRRRECEGRWMQASRSGGMGERKDTSIGGAMPDAVSKVNGIADGMLADCYDELPLYNAEPACSAVSNRMDSLDMLHPVRIAN